MERPDYKLEGLTFGKLTVVMKYDGKWLCKCECGEMTIQDTYNLTHGRVISCGCFRKESIAKRSAGAKKLQEKKEQYRKEQREENKQACTCRFASKTALSCTILRKLYCNMEICNFWKPQEEDK